MFFTIRSDLALRVLEALRDKGEGRNWKAWELAMLLGVSKEHLAKVLQVLTRQGWLASTRGPTGGYRRAYLEGIAIVDVLQAMDGEGASEHPRHPVLQAATDAVWRTLEESGATV